MGAPWLVQLVKLFVAASGGQTRVLIFWYYSVATWGRCAELLGIGTSHSSTTFFPFTFHFVSNIPRARLFCSLYSVSPFNKRKANVISISLPSIFAAAVYIFSCRPINVFNSRRWITFSSACLSPRLSFSSSSREYDFT
jgi:hypothetical protein